MGISGTDKALMYAQAGVARAGATRCGYHSSKVFIAIDGIQYANARATDSEKILHDSLSITKIINNIPDTAAFTAYGFAPTEGQDVVMTLGSINNMTRLFAGTIINRKQRYIGTPGNWYVDVNAIDYTWLMMQRRFSGTYTNTSASVIGNAIVAAVPGMTSGIVSGLPTLDTFSVADADCLSALSQLAKRIGGYCDVDYHKVVKLFITDDSVTNPRDLTAIHPTLMQIDCTRDLSQVVT